MAYKLHYSDYPGTDTGPPDPASWIGPPGPQGPQGPQGQPQTGGPFLPLSGGTVTGPITGLTGPTIGLTGPGIVLSVPNGLNVTSNFSGSGFPAFWNTSRMVFARQITSANDFCDFQFQRTTSFAGGTQANLLACMRVIGNYGAGDGCNNWNIVSQAQTHGTSGGLTLGMFSTAQRLSGATDTIFGAVLNGTDLTGLPSATSGGAVLGVEVDCQVQDRDTRANLAMFGGTGNRIGVDIVAVRNGAATSPPTEVSAGLWFTSSNITGNAGAGVTADPYTNYLSAISFGVNTQAYQALDTRGAIVPTGVADPFAAVRMLHDQIIDFNGGASLKSVAGNYLQYRAGTQRLYYVVAGVDQWSVDAGGNVRARGTFTPSTTP